MYYLYFRYSFTVFANVFVYSVTWGVLHITSDDANNQIGPNDVFKFQYIVIIGMIIGSLATIVFHAFVKEIPHDSTGNFFIII